MTAKDVTGLIRPRCNMSSPDYHSIILSHVHTTWPDCLAISQTMPTYLVFRYIPPSPVPGRVLLTVMKRDGPRTRVSVDPANAMELDPMVHAICVDIENMLSMYICGAPRDCSRALQQVARLAQQRGDMMTQLEQAMGAMEADMQRKLDASQRQLDELYARQLSEMPLPSSPPEADDFFEDASILDDMHDDDASDGHAMV